MKSPRDRARSRKISLANAFSQWVPRLAFCLPQGLSYRFSVFWRLQRIYRRLFGPAPLFLPEPGRLSVFSFPVPKVFEEPIFYRTDQLFFSENNYHFSEFVQSSSA